MSDTHIRYEDDEWHLVDNETHEILCSADTREELESQLEDYA